LPPFACILYIAGQLLSCRLQCTLGNMMPIKHPLAYRQTAGAMNHARIESDSIQPPMFFCAAMSLSANFGRDPM